jgi:hypothetical protein
VVVAVVVVTAIRIVCLGFFFVVFVVSYKGFLYMCVCESFVIYPNSWIVTAHEHANFSSGELRGKKWKQ